MPQPSILIENLSKRYLRRAHSAQTFIANEIIRQLTSLGRRMHSNTQTDHTLNDERYLWALRDINLEAREGDVIGFVGRNGSGKSTLLKIIARTTRPTRGRAVVFGRAGCLLEAGTGFHPELTGRENIFLNGMILGMTRKRIQQYFDEIVEFSGVCDQLDTPVKFFSTGQIIRLGFSVAAYLDHEILLIDEVLAVGDAEFRRQCFDKMAELARQGRTILIVSHQMEYLQQLCNKGALLDRGQLVAYGDWSQIVQKYASVVAAQEFPVSVS